MAMKIEKILSCICVFVILMSVVPVSVFAVDSGTTNASGKYNSFQDSNEKVSSMQGGQEVKFIGTAIEYHEGLTMPGDWPWWKVSVDEIISGPSELKGHTVIVSPGVIDPGYMDPNIKLGDTVKVYGNYQEVDNVWIDSSNYYITKDEKKPDLIIKDISWSPSNPNMGDTITFTVKIKNQGSGSAGSSTVKYYISLSYVDFDSVPSLSAGSTSTQTFTWTADKCGDLSVTAKADANSAVTECNEGNNDRTEGTNIFCEETKPVPKVTKVGIDPSTCVKEDEYATISVTVANNGGASNEGYISVSFPNDEYVYVVSGTGNKYNTVYRKDDLIWNSAGVQMKAVDPLVELFDTDWDGGQQEFITMNVKPNSGSDEIVFYVRAALKNDAAGDYERDPTYSGNTDQQGWYVKKYSVDVCEYEKVKIRGEILVDYPIISYYNFDVKIDEILEDPTGNLQEGETVNVYGHRSGPAQVDDVTVGDEVEVFGEYRGYGGEYKQIFLSEWEDSSSDHYLKKISSFDLEVTDISFSRLPYEEEPVTITATVKNNGNYGESNVHVTFWDGLDEIGYKVINYIPEHQSATTAIQWEDPEKSFEPTKSNNYHTNNVGASVNGVPYLKGVTVGDMGGIGYSINVIETSEVPVSVKYPQAVMLFKFDSMITYTGKAREYIQDMSMLYGTIGAGLETASHFACAEAVIISVYSTGSPLPGLAICAGAPIGTFMQLAANLLHDTADLWPISSDVEPSSDGNIYIMYIASLDKTSENDKTTSDKYNIDLYYKDKTGTWIQYYNAKTNIIQQSPNQLSATIECPANLHAYDSEGRHVGLNSFGKIELEIPGSYYTGPDYEPESIVLLKQSGDITFKVEAVDTGEFDFTLTKSTETKTTAVSYLDVPITQATEATVDVSQANPAYTMEIDDDGDGTPEHETWPDSIEIVGPTQCPLDMNDDNYVNAQDIVYLLTHGEWGSNQGHIWDLNDDNYVNAQDVVYALTQGHWGACP